MSNLKTGMTINELVVAAHTNAISKGWWESGRDPLAVHMLIVSEVAEASECVRNGKPEVYQVHKVGPSDPETYDVMPRDFDWNPELKPEGEAIELADAVIRIMDYFGKNNWNLEECILKKMHYNANRSYRHGGKKA